MKRATLVLSAIAIALLMAAGSDGGGGGKAEPVRDGYSAECTPTHVRLERSPTLRKTPGRTTVALIGCQEDLDKFSPDDLAAAEEEILRTADAESWWGVGIPSPAVQAAAGSRLSQVLNSRRPVKVFFHSSR